MKKQRKKLHMKLTVLYTCFAVVIGMFISAFGYYMMFQQAVDFYSEKARQAAAVGVSYVDGDAVAGYLDSGETDAAYDKLCQQLNEVKGQMDLTYFYVFQPREAHFVYVVEAMVDTDNPEYISGMGDIYEYSEWEYEYLVPDVAAKRSSQEGLMSMENPFFGVGVSAWVPVLDSQGEVAAMVEADIHLDQVLTSIQSAIIVMLAVYVMLILAMVLLQAVAIRRMISVPLQKLTDRTLHFAAEGQLSGFDDDITTGDELQTLSEAFGQMARDIATYTDERADLAAEKERIATELEVATDIQQSLLPDALPDFPGRKYMDIHGQLHPSQEMEGHFFDYFLLDDRRVGVVICGTQTTGIPAAMMLVVTRTVIKSQFTGDRPLAETMGRINRQVWEAMEHKQPITAFVGVLDTWDGSFTYVNAGYNPPMIMRRGERCELLACTASIPLGMERNVSYRDVTMHLHQGDRLLFYSDGVIKAKNPHQDSFGVERLRNTLGNTRSGDGAEKMVDAVLSTVMRFTGKTAAEDDMVLLALEFKRGDRGLARLGLQPVMDCVPQLQGFLREQMASNNITGKDYARVLVCAEELFSICCKYAGGNWVEAECAVPGEDRIEVRFFADFRGGDPLSESTNKTVQNAAAFIRSNMDRLELESRDGQSALVMCSTIHRQPGSGGPAST